MKIFTVAAAGLIVTAGLGAAGCDSGLEQRVAAQVRASAAANQQFSHLHTGPDYTRTLEGIRQAYGVVLQNLANAQTPGYQAIRPVFERVQDATFVGTNDLLEPVMIRDISPGRPVNTGRWMDVAIQGAGYFILDDPNGGGVDGLSYSRVGQLFVNADNMLVLGSPDGPPLEPVVVFPDEFRELRITNDGQIEVRTAPRARWHVVGIIHLARFANETALQPRPTGWLIASAESGPPMVDTPGGTGLGTLLQKHLEGSNVDLSHELAELEHLKDWGQTLAHAMDVAPGFRDVQPAAAQWGAAITSPASAKRLSAAGR